VHSDWQVLNIIVSDEDRCNNTPMYQYLVQSAHESGLAGATVLHGLMSFGAHSRLHYSGVEAMMGGLPLSILIVDAKPKIEAFVAQVREVLPDGFISTWDVDVHLYRHGAAT
jgi:PII-like signaling protein